MTCFVYNDVVYDDDDDVVVVADDNDDDVVVVVDDDDVSLKLMRASYCCCWVLMTMIMIGLLCKMCDIYGQAVTTKSQKRKWHIKTVVMNSAKYVPHVWHIRSGAIYGPTIIIVILSCGGCKKFPRTFNQRCCFSDP